VTVLARRLRGADAARALSRGRIPIAALVLSLLLLSSRAPARAEDWLASLPDCADRPSAPRFEVLYPRRGLPALVHGGERLVARVRLPVALTPPPGVQQPRALQGWRAELVGHALPWPPSASVEQRHALDVVDVRPDASSSLVYRASIAIPAWVAPGSYDLALWAPGGAGRVVNSLRVIAPGRPPRLAWIAEDAVPAELAVAALPVDAWVRAAQPDTPDSSAPADSALSSASELAPAPLLEPHGLIAALRVGAGLWVIGDCPSPRAERARQDEVLALRAQEHLAWLEPRSFVAPGQWQAFEMAARAWPPRGSLVLAQAGEQLLVRVRADYGAEAAELALALPGDSRSVQSDGDASVLALHPAADFAVTSSSSRAALVALLRLEPGCDVRLRRGPARELHARLEAPPNAAASFEPMRLRVRGAPAGARVAWQLDDGHTAFGASSIEHAFGALGEHRIEALVIAADGSTARLHAAVRVRTAVASGCRCSALGRARPQRVGPWLGAVFGLLLRRWRSRRLAKKTAAPRSSE
jgi:hypothetical protein